MAELFELAKLDAREIQPDCEAFSLPELVQDVVQEFQLRAQEKGVELSADLSERLPFVNADIRLIERVLENLIENVLRYTPRGGAIEITLRQEEGRVKVEIHDSGVGSGLGLAISKRILELHQSMIEATSQLNQGTTFTFRLAGA